MAELIQCKEYFQKIYQVSQNVIYLHTGSNLYNRKENLERARQNIGLLIGDIQQVSNLYETAAWGIEQQPDFLNQVIVVNSTLSPLEILNQIQFIENKLGRVKKIKWGERIIDIDILFYNRLIYRHPDLTIPHPEIQNRNFVLVPLAEIAPKFTHPVSNLTVEELLQRCPDKLQVTIYNP